jgi:apolipoprotein N-acyltransferase
VIELDFGRVLGGSLGVALMCLIINWILKRFLSGNSLIVITVLCAVVAATVLSAFVVGYPGQVNFADRFAIYGPGGMVVLIVWLLRTRARDKSNG